MDPNTKKYVSAIGHCRPTMWDIQILFLNWYQNTQKVWHHSYVSSFICAQLDMAINDWQLLLYNLEAKVNIRLLYSFHKRSLHGAPTTDTVNSIDVPQMFSWVNLQSIKLNLSQHTIDYVEMEDRAIRIQADLFIVGVPSVGIGFNQGRIHCEMLCN